MRIWTNIRPQIVFNFRGSLVYRAVNFECINLKVCCYSRTFPLFRAYNDTKLFLISLCAMSTMSLLSQAFNNHLLFNGRSRWRHYFAFKFPMLYSNWLAWDACKRYHQPCVRII